MKLGAHQQRLLQRAYEHGTNIDIYRYANKRDRMTFDRLAELGLLTITHTTRSASLHSADFAMVTLTGQGRKALGLPQAKPGFVSIGGRRQ